MDTFGANHSVDTDENTEAPAEDRKWLWAYP